MIKIRAYILMMVVVFPLLSYGRGVRPLEIHDLIGKSKLVFVGMPLSIEASGITTTMSYPTWAGTRFEWLKVDVVVVDAIKGVQNGELVHTLMLSAQGSPPMNDPPGMVEPVINRLYLFCLLPTTVSNAFASITAPWDDKYGIFLLDRISMSPPNARFYKDGVQVPFNEQNERNAVIWNLVNDNGILQHNTVEEVLNTYAEEIKSVPPTNSIIHLQWETYESDTGWQWDVPKGFGNLSNQIENTQNKGVQAIDAKASQPDP